MFPIIQQFIQSIIQQFIQSITQHILVINIKNLATHFGSMNHEPSKKTNSEVGYIPSHF